MKPPVLARALLLAAAGEAHAELVAGDLYEEFLYLCAERGGGTGRRWYAWQVVRSVPALLQLRIRSGEMAQMVTAVALVAIPLLLLDRCWRLVYSQIPLKDGLGRAPEFLAVNLAMACLGSVAAGRMARSPRGRMALAGAAMGGAALGIWASVGRAPAGYVAAVLAAAPVCSWAATKWGRRRVR